MKLHSLESFGAVDGPGVRFVAFLSGCPFRCRYCHNPDTWARPAAFEMKPAEVLAKALRFRPYWGADGGITASGGEPMLQAISRKRSISVISESILWSSRYACLRYSFAVIYSRSSLSLLISISPSTSVRTSNQSERKNRSRLSI